MLRLRGMCANFSHGQTVLMLVILCKSHDSDLTFEPCVTPPIISRFRPYLDALLLILCIFLI